MELAHTDVEPLQPPGGDLCFATRKLRVLLAEDDPDPRRLLATSLRRLGYEVVEAGDGVSCSSASSTLPWSTAKARTHVRRSSPTT